MYKTPIDTFPITKEMAELIPHKERLEFNIKHLDEACRKYGFENNVLKGELEGLERRYNELKGMLVKAIEYNVKLEKR